MAYWCLGQVAVLQSRILLELDWLSTAWGFFLMEISRTSLKSHTRWLSSSRRTRAGDLVTVDRSDWLEKMSSDSETEYALSDADCRMGALSTTKAPIWSQMGFHMSRPTKMASLNRLACCTVSKLPLPKGTLRSQKH